MMSLSVTLIARNESENIKSCLDSVSFADQIVVVEQGSTDNSAQMARDAGARVITVEDWPGFGPQKNRALEVATGDWVLSIDADERVTPMLQKEIERAMASGEFVAYEIPRLTQFCGQWIRHCGWTPDHVVRLFKRDQARFSDDLVHEKLILHNAKTKIGRLKEPLLHYSYPTPEHYWRKLQRYSQDWAKQRYTEGKKTTMVRAALSGITAFFRSYLFRLGFLDGAMGFAVCTMQAQAAFGKYFELYCLNRQNEK
jgi:glycosyltransferase involved in cell wall biosynthesis